MLQYKGIGYPFFVWFHVCQLTCNYVNFDIFRFYSKCLGVQKNNPKNISSYKNLSYILWKWTISRLVGRVCVKGGGGYCEYNLQLYHESKGAIFVIVEKQGFNYFWVIDLSFASNSFKNANKTGAVFSTFINLEFILSRRSSLSLSRVYF